MSYPEAYYSYLLLFRAVIILSCDNLLKPISKEKRHPGVNKAFLCCFNATTRRVYIYHELTSWKNAWSSKTIMGFDFRNHYTDLFSKMLLELDTFLNISFIYGVSWSCRQLMSVWSRYTQTLYKFPTCSCQCTLILTCHCSLIHCRASLNRLQLW